MTTILSNGLLFDVKGRPFPLDRSSFPRITGPSAGLVPLLSKGGKPRAATYEAMVRSQPWVYAAIRTLVKGAIMPPLKTYDGEEATERKRVRAHPLPRLISRPYMRARWTKLMTRVAWDYYVHGQVLLLPVAKTRGATPYELWSVPWRYVQKIEDDFGILGFNVCLGGEQHPLALEDVIYIPNLLGFSPLESLRRTLALEDATMDWQGASIENGITPRAVFKAKSGSLSKDEKAQTAVRAELQKLYAGQDKASNFALLGGEWDVSELGVSAVDLAIIEQRKLSREEVAGALGITPPLIGILDRATFNNVSELVRQFYTLTLAPDLVTISDCFQAQLVDPYPEWDGLYLEFDTDVVLKPSPLQRAQMHLMMQQSGTNATNERRKYENLPPDGDPDDPANPANHPLRPENMAPVNQLAVAVSTSAEPAPASAAQPAQASGLRDQLVLEAVRAGSPTPPTQDLED